MQSKKESQMSKNIKFEKKISKYHSKLKTDPTKNKFITIKGKHLTAWCTHLHFKLLTNEYVILYLHT